MKWTEEEREFEKKHFGLVDWNNESKEAPKMQGIASMISNNEIKDSKPKTGEEFQKAINELFKREIKVKPVRFYLPITISRDKKYSIEEVKTLIDYVGNRLDEIYVSPSFNDNLIYHIKRLDLVDYAVKKGVISVK